MAKKAAPASKTKTKVKASKPVKASAKTTAKVGASKPVKTSTTAKVTRTKASTDSAASKPAGKKQHGAGVLVKPAVAKKIMDSLCATYPDADCELTYASPFQLLIAVILSAQCTDVTINKVTKALFKHYPDARSLAEADIEHVKELIKPSGFFNAKAKNIQACAQELVVRFNGIPPQTREELTTLAGVGRKTANVVLGVIHNIPGWTVDTHVQRLSKRLGFSLEADPLKIEQDLEKLFPKQDWTKYSITIIWHGRRLCFARKPDCPNCPVKDLCPSAQA